MKWACAASASALLGAPIREVWFTGKSACYVTLYHKRQRGCVSSFSPTNFGTSSLLKIYGYYTQKYAYIDSCLRYLLYFCLHCSSDAFVQLWYRLSELRYSLYKLCASISRGTAWNISGGLLAVSFKKVGQWLDAYPSLYGSVSPTWISPAGDWRFYIMIKRLPISLMRFVLPVSRHSVSLVISYSTGVSSSWLPPSSAGR